MQILHRELNFKFSGVRYFSFCALSLMFFLLLISSSCSKETGDKGPPSSFKGLRWGTNIAELQDMVFLELQDQLKAYKRQNDALKIESVEIDSLVYLFYEDKFSGLMAEYSGLNTHEKIKELYFSKYGQAVTSQEQKGVIKWVWPSELMLLIKYDAQAEKGSIFYAYIPLLFQRRGAQYKVVK